MKSVAKSNARSLSIAVQKGREQNAPSTADG